MAKGATALSLVGRVVMALAGLIALIIALGILFQVLRANPDNAIVGLFLDVGGFFVGPFDGMFLPRDRRVEIGINWGIALVAYLVVGSLLAGLLRRGDGDDPARRVGPTP